MKLEPVYEAGRRDAVKHVCQESQSLDLARPMNPMHSSISPRTWS
jgi:hypothetical protein